MYGLRGGALLVGVFWAQSILVGDPGFGTLLRKKKVDLEIRQPAAIRLANTSVAFTGSVTSPAYASVRDSLLATLETEILGNEKTLVKKSPGEADWVLGLRVTGFSVAEPKQRTDNMGKNSVTYVRWTGSLRTAYQVLDRAGRSHAAGNVESSYDKVHQTGGTFGKTALTRIPIPHRKKADPADQIPQSTEDVKQILIHQVVAKIATKLGNTKQPVEVQIAGGDEHLNRAAEFMEKRLWARALEELEKTPPFPKPESEAYRQYDLGLVYEAMSYDAKTFSDQKANLFAAEEYYDKALEFNRKEKYFVATVARTKDALARYKAFEGMQKEDLKQSQVQVQAKQELRPQQQPQAQQRSRSQQPKADSNMAASDALNNQKPIPRVARPVSTKTAAAKSRAKTIKITDVVEMFSSGVPEAQIVDIIQHSPVVFDPLDKDTAVLTAKAKLPLSVQNELRKKVGAPLLGVAKPAPAAPKK